VSKKDFDCVEMKRRAQETLLEEWRGHTEDEIREMRDARIRANPILARFWNRPPRAKAS